MVRLRRDGEGFEKQTSLCISAQKPQMRRAGKQGNLEFVFYGWVVVVVVGVAL